MNEKQEAETILYKLTQFKSISSIPRYEAELIMNSINPIELEKECKKLGIVMDRNVEKFKKLFKDENLPNDTIECYLKKYESSFTNP